MLQLLAVCSIRPLLAEHLDELGRVVFDHEGNQVGHTLAGWLPGEPEFKILQPVIVPDTILMMDVLFWQKPATEMLLNDVAMLEDRSSINADFKITIPVEVSSVLVCRDLSRFAVPSPPVVMEPAPAPS